MTKVGKRHVDLDPGSPNGLTGDDIFLGAGRDTIGAEFEKLGGVLMLKEQYPQGTPGGNSTTSWNLRRLNTVVANTIDGAVVDTGSGSLKIPSGLYILDATGSMFYAGMTTLRLYDYVKSAVVDYGPSDWMRNASNDTDFATLHSVINVPAPVNLRLYQYASTARTNGMGLPANISGLPEVYATLRLLKVK